MKYILLFLLLPLLVVGQTQTPEYKEALKNRKKYLLSTRPEQKKFVKTIPFTYEPNHQVVVPVLIGGKTYNFLFDTGAVTVVSKEIAAELSLPAIFQNKLKDGGGQVQEETIYNLPALQLAGIDFKNVAVATADMKRFGTTFCVNIDGLLGTNVLRSCRWKVDYSGGVLTFSDKEIKPSEDLHAIDFKENFSGSPLLETQMFGYSVNMLMDTGYNGAVAIADSLYFKSVKTHARPYRKGYGTTTVTLFENTYKEKYVGLTDSIYIANKRHLVLDALTDVDHAEIYMLGNEIFEAYGEIILDWKKHRLYMPQKVINDRDVYTTFGFAPVLVGNQLIVSVVWEGTDAAVAGIKPGYVITAINNEDTTNITQERWCGLVSVFKDKKDAQINISVQDKEGVVTAYTLKLTELLRE